MNPLKPIFSDEVQLAGWRESHTAGPLVTFRLTDPSLMSVFRGMTVVKGNVAGQRLAMVLVEIADDETPREPEPVHAEHRKLGPLGLLAVQWCREPSFREWLWKDVWKVDEDGVLRRMEHIPDEKAAAVLVRELCGVASRREIDEKPVAARAFEERIRKVYMKHQAKLLVPEFAAGHSATSPGENHGIPPEGTEGVEGVEVVGA
jgi:hypothetical protein